VASFLFWVSPLSVRRLLGGNRGRFHFIFLVFSLITPGKRDCFAHFRIQWKVAFPSSAETEQRENNIRTSWRALVFRSVKISFATSWYGSVPCRIRRKSGSSNIICRVTNTSRQGTPHGLRQRFLLFINVVFAPFSIVKQSAFYSEFRTVWCVVSAFASLCKGPYRLYKTTAWRPIKQRTFFFRLFFCVSPTSLALCSWARSHGVGGLSGTIFFFQWRNSAVRWHSSKNRTILSCA